MELIRLRHWYQDVHQVLQEQQQLRLIKRRQYHQQIVIRRFALEQILH